MKYRLIKIEPKKLHHYSHNTDENFAGSFAVTLAADPKYTDRTLYQLEPAEKEFVFGELWKQNNKVLKAGQWIYKVKTDRTRFTDTFYYVAIDQRKGLVYFNTSDESITFETAGTRIEYLNLITPIEYLP